ncbi:hypothetical protein ILUMI_06617 [Ignelater luminosus]|uniref:C2H2-type domain-containing protein n=1 Tax=Ignelater luminosus TaxID=2038154 RepID=A0A8K0D9L8_IGNLU|nr:hypothetical protein ILUMI_06617 [Ignelater luminosus]
MQRPVLPRSIYGSQPERTPSEEMMLPGSQCSIQSVGTSESEYAGETSAPRLFSQNELSDLIRDLYLSKHASKLLAYRLKEKNLLRPEVTITPLNEQLGIKQEIDTTQIKLEPLEVSDVDLKETPFTDCYKLNKTKSCKKPPYKCVKCNYCSSTEHTLKRHMIVHIDKKAFQCDYCGFQTKAYKYLQNHVYKLHSEHKLNSCQYDGTGRNRLLVTGSSSVTRRLREWSVGPMRADEAVGSSDVVSLWEVVATEARGVGGVLTWCGATVSSGHLSDQP